MPYDCTIQAGSPSRITKVLENRQTPAPGKVPVPVDLSSCRPPSVNGIPTMSVSGSDLHGHEWGGPGRTRTRGTGHTCAPRSGKVFDSVLGGSASVDEGQLPYTKPIDIHASDISSPGYGTWKGELDFHATVKVGLL